MLRTFFDRRTSLVLATALSVAMMSCKKDKKETKESPGPAATSKVQGGKDKKPGDASAKKARQLALTLPSKDKIEKIVNPKKRKPYAGAVGGVKGVVTIKGDQAPELPEILAKMESNCIDSRAMFGKVFREGSGRTLADALVAVTEYEGYVPIKETDVVVEAKGCAFQKRTVALTYGQRVVVRGVDNRPYVPEILGQPLPAQLFVLPTQPTVAIAPHQPGRFKLVDSMRLYNLAELFVLPYATVDVTGLDGAFEIRGIPVGPAKINALLPQTGAVDGQEIVIEEGKTVEVALEIEFDKEAWDKLPKQPALDELPGPRDKK